LLLQLGEDCVRILVGPVCQHDHVLAIIAVGFAVGGLDDDGRVHTGLLLQLGMAVVPVGTALLDREAVGEGRTRRDPAKADPWHPVHVGGQDDPMPMDGRWLVQAVGNADRHVLALAPSEYRAGHGPVDRRDQPIPSRHVDRLFL